MSLCAKQGRHLFLDLPRFAQSCRVQIKVNTIRVSVRLKQTTKSHAHERPLCDTCELSACSTVGLGPRRMNISLTDITTGSLVSLDQGTETQTFQIIVKGLVKPTLELKYEDKNTLKD